VHLAYSESDPRRWGDGNSNQRKELKMTLFEIWIGCAASIFVICNGYEFLSSELWKRKDRKITRSVPMEKHLEWYRLKSEKEMLEYKAMIALLKGRDISETLNAIQASIEHEKKNKR
jgi:hypothetical protein